VSEKNIAMGCTSSSEHQNDETKTINKLLSEERKKDANTIKVLLLGPGGVGKSTFLKQLLFTSGTQSSISRTAMNEYILEGMANLVSALESEGKLPDESAIRDAVVLVQNSPELDLNTIDAIKLLWKN